MPCNFFFDLLSCVFAAADVNIAVFALLVSLALPGLDDRPIAPGMIFFYTPGFQLCSVLVFTKGRHPAASVFRTREVYSWVRHKEGKVGT